MAETQQGEGKGVSGGIGVNWWPRADSARAGLPPGLMQAMSHDAPFWQTKSLAAMSDAEWE